MAAVFRSVRYSRRCVEESVCSSNAPAFQLEPSKSAQAQRVLVEDLEQCASMSEDTRRACARVNGELITVRTLPASIRNEERRDDVCRLPGLERQLDALKMKYGGILGPWLWRAATLLDATVMLSGAAIYNGYPLVYPDTGDYVALADISFRSIYYSLLIAPARLTGSLWPVVFFQSLIVAHLLRLILRIAFAIVSGPSFLTIIALLCVLTSLPWYTGFIMPDIFTGVLVLGLFLLGFCPSSLSGRERKYVAVLIVAASVVHLSHIPLALGLLFVALFVRLILRQRREMRLPNVAVPTLLVVAALLLILTKSCVMQHELAFAPGGYAFPLARLVADGQAVSYLRRNCSARRYALCKYVGELPQGSSDFLWSLDSPFRKVGWIDGYRREGREIVWRTINHYPLWTLESAARNTIAQIVAVRTGNAFISWVNKAYPSDELRMCYRAEFDNYESSRQSLKLLPLDSLNYLDMTVLVLSVIYSGMAGFLFAKHRQWTPVQLQLTITTAVLINAFVVGTLSGPNSRYGSRVIWLLPFFALASYRDVLELMRVKRK